MKILFRLVKILIGFYIVICVLLYFFQEKLIFFPEKFGKNHTFHFDQPVEEVTIKATDNTELHGLLFKSSNSKGVIFYLHGNAGSVDSWGDVAKTYTAMQYDVFMPDYRGYGKSEGSISSQQQFFDDVQIAYNEVKKRYTEDKIIVLGYSIGTGAAAKTAAVNNPRLLILQAPYYSLTDMMRHAYPIIPTFILKYKFETNEYVQQCKMPVVIFHGDQDEVIYYNSSVKLKSLLKAKDTLITLHGQGHNGMTDNPEYIQGMQKLLRAETSNPIQPASFQGNIISSIQSDTTELVEHIVDTVQPGRSKHNKVELLRYTTAEDGYVILKFFARQGNGWQLKQTMKIDEINIPGMDTEFADFNNDGYKDMTFRSLVAARGANDVRKLLIYDRKNDSLILIKNSNDYPNLLYNKTLNCIDAFMVYGGSSTVFLRLKKDSLIEFAGVSLDDIITVYEIDKKGQQKILRQDSNTTWHYVRFKNYKPLVPYNDH